MNEQEAIKQIEERLEEDRQALTKLSLADFAWEWTRQFGRQPDLSKGQANLIEQIIADRRQKALAG